MENLVQYLVAAMVAWVPLHHHLPSEQPDDVHARYESIARDLVTVAADEEEAPLFNGPDARVQTAVLMLSVASFESSFRKSVDDGRGLGDRGLSYCLMQIHVGGGLTREGWTGPQLVKDRKLCFRAALHILRASFGACHSLPLEDRLSAYASGHCFAEAAISRSRVGRARAWWRAHAPPTWPSTAPPAIEPGTEPTEG
jgi:hypothetical protein